VGWRVCRPPTSLGLKLKLEGVHSREAPRSSIREGGKMTERILGSEYYTNYSSVSRFRVSLALFYIYSLGHWRTAFGRGQTWISARGW